MKITRRQLRQIIRESISTGDFLRGLQMSGSTNIGFGIGDRVKVAYGKHRGKRGTITDVYDAFDEYMVALDDGPEMTFEHVDLEFIGPV